jgi:hypothetical protein
METMKLTNPFDYQGQWFKANFHTHTTTSDGDSSPAQRVSQYRSNGYDILALTDHGIVNNTEHLSSDSFLMISGIELHPPCANSKYHLIGLNVPHDFSVPQDCYVNECIKAVRHAGGEVIYGHPYWCGQNINHLLTVDGYIAIEVYNATCSKIGKGFSSVHWDDLLETGRVVGAIAVDDTHYGRDIFMGWTWIRAEQLSAEAVMQALRTGCYYCSCGPTIEDFRIIDGQAIIRCSPAMEIHFIAQNSNGLSYYADGDKLLTHAEFKLTDNLKYVRSEIIDQHGNHACTNPIVL